MSATPFDQAVALILLHEGGWSNDPDDPGHETNLGITAKTLELAQQRGLVSSKTTVRGITVDEAKAIYRAFYWNEVHAEVLPRALAICVFDAAVNQGVSAAVSLLQDALHVTADGIMGPETIQAAQRRGDPDMVDRYMAARAARYVDNVIRKPALMRFRAGWLKRCFATARAAAVLGVSA